MKKERLDCPYDFTSRCTMGRCDCKPKEELEKEQTKNTFNDQDMINFLKSVFGMEGFDYEKALEKFKNK